MLFCAEGINAEKIKPLYYPIRVDINEVHNGISSVYKYLRANAFKHNSNRQVVSTFYDNIMEQSIGKYTNVDDFEALKHVIFVVYYSLPNGALPHLPVSDTDNLFRCLVESNSWNSILDYIWRAEIATATSSDKFMECCLLLELHVNKNCLSKDQKTLSLLSQASEAMRCSSVSSVALRIFALDKHLLYDHFYKVPAASPHGYNTAEILSSRVSERSRRKITQTKSASLYTEVGYNPFDLHEHGDEMDNDDVDYDDDSDH